MMVNSPSNAQPPKRDCKEDGHKGNVEKPSLIEGESTVKNVENDSCFKPSC